MTFFFSFSSLEKGGAALPPRAKNEAPLEISTDVLLHENL